MNTNHDAAMSDWATHTLFGRPCASTGASPIWVYFMWQGQTSVNAIPREAWQEHAKPIIKVGAATLPWVSVEDVPHPVDGSKFLSLWNDGSVLSTRPEGPILHVTHWCRLPEAVQP